MDKQNFERINDLIEEGLTKKAIRELKKLKEVNKNDYIINCLLMKTYKKIGAFEEIKQLLDENENHKEKYIIYDAQLDIENGEVEKGKKKLKRIANITNNEVAINQLAALEERSGDLKEAEKYFNLSLELNNDNIYSLNGLAQLAKKKEDYSLAEYYYNKIIDVSGKKTFSHKEKVLEIGIIGLVQLEIKRKNYDRAYMYMQKMAKVSNKPTHRQIIFYLKNKLNILSEEEKEYEGMKYDEKQFLNYSIEEAKKHVEKHVHENNTIKKHTLFYKDIDIDKIFEKVTEKLPQAILTKSTVVDNYLVELDENIAEIKGQTTNKVMVITEVNTNNILTMYPVFPYYNSKMEIETEKEEYHSTYQRKRQSQIEKFNQRYNRK